MQHHILLVAHGSKSSGYTNEVRAVGRELARAAGIPVHCAFLEINEPDIVNGVAACAGAGAERVSVVPYFLTRGRHLVEDIPRELDDARAEHPGVEVNLMPHMGSHPDVPELLADLVRQDMDELDTLLMVLDDNQPMTPRLPPTASPASEAELEYDEVASESGIVYEASDSAIVYEPFGSDPPTFPAIKPPPPKVGDDE